MGSSKYFVTESVYQQKCNKKKSFGNMNCYKSRVSHDQYNAFQSTFSGNNLISYDEFRENFQNIVHNIQTLGKKYPEKKHHVMDIFSLKN